MTRMVENAGTMSWEWLEGRTVADGQADAARVYVARVAVDGDDEAALLAALGLDGAP